MLDFRKKLRNSLRQQERLPLWKRNVLHWRRVWRRLLLNSMKYLASTKKNSRSAKSCSMNLKIWRVKLESTAALDLSRRLSWLKQKDQNLAAESLMICRLPLDLKEGPKIITSILFSVLTVPKTKSSKIPNVWFRVQLMGIMYVSSLMAKQDQERPLQYKAVQKCQVWHQEP